MTSFVVLTQGRDQPEITLALADRDKYPDKFWTTRILEAKVYNIEAAANNRVRQILHNNPRYVPYEEARALLEAQARAKPKPKAKAPLNPALPKFPNDRRKT